MILPQQHVDRRALGTPRPRTHGFPPHLSEASAAAGFRFRTGFRPFRVSLKWRHSREIRMASMQIC